MQKATVINMISYVRYTSTTCHFRRLIDKLNKIIRCGITVYFVVGNFLIILKIHIQSLLDPFQGLRFYSR